MTVKVTEQHIAQGQAVLAKFAWDMDGDERKELLDAICQAITDAQGEREAGRYICTKCLQDNPVGMACWKCGREGDWADDAARGVVDAISPSDFEDAQVSTGIPSSRTPFASGQATLKSIAAIIRDTSPSAPPLSLALQAEIRARHERAVYWAKMSSSATTILDSLNDISRLLTLVRESAVEVVQLKQWLDDALVRQTEEQDEHSAQRAELVKEIAKLRERGDGWQSIAEVGEPEYGERVEVFSPAYPIGDSMRVRIVSWIIRLSDATHWRRIVEPSLPPGQPEKGKAQG